MKCSRLLGTALAIAALASLGACGHSAQLQHAVGTPQARQDQAKAEAIVRGCVSKGNFLSKSGRVAVLRCIAPPGHKAAFEQCASSAAGKGVFSSGQRKRFYKALAVCAERNR